MRVETAFKGWLSSGIPIQRAFAGWANLITATRGVYVFSGNSSILQDKSGTTERGDTEV